MADQPGFKTLLENLKRQLLGYQQARKLPLQDKEQLKAQPSELVREEYVGPPLEIGNELLITAGIIKLYSGLSNALGRVVIIDQIPTEKDKAIKASAFGIQVDVNLNVAHHMRAAYLRREQAQS